MTSQVAVRTDILAELPGEPRLHFRQRRAVAVGQHDAGAIGHQPRRCRRADPARAAGDQRDLADQRLGGGHALELGFLEQPVFDVEGLLFIEADIVADGFRAAHDIDRIAIEFAREARGGLVAGEGDPPDARDQHDHRVGIAHRGGVGALAVVIIGRI